MVFVTEEFSGLTHQPKTAVITPLDETVAFDVGRLYMWQIAVPVVVIIVLLVLVFLLMLANCLAFCWWRKYKSRFSRPGMEFLSTLNNLEITRSQEPQLVSICLQQEVAILRLQLNKRQRYLENLLGHTPQLINAFDSERLMMDSSLDCLPLQPEQSVIQTGSNGFINYQQQTMAKDQPFDPRFELMPSYGTETNDASLSADGLI